jgi:type IV secretory pathway VirB10-like protein
MTRSRTDHSSINMHASKTTSVFLALLCLLLGATAVGAADLPLMQPGGVLSPAPAPAPAPTPIFKTINESITVGSGVPASPKVVVEAIVVSSEAPAPSSVVTEAIVVGTQAPVAVVVDAMKGSQEAADASAKAEAADASAKAEAADASAKAEAADASAKAEAADASAKAEAADASAKAPPSERRTQESRAEAGTRDAFARSTGATIQTAGESGSSGLLTSPWMLILYAAIALVGAAGAFILRGKLWGSN